MQQEYSNDDQEINNSTNDDDDDVDDDNDNDEGYSALLVDPIRAFGEVIDSNETTDENDCEDMECPDEDLLIEHDVDDDEDDA